MRFTHHLPPALASNNPRHHVGPARAAYQRTLDEMLLHVRSERNRRLLPPLAGKATVFLDTYVADERGVDVDATAKCVLDSLQHGGALANDKQVSMLVARRIVGVGSPRLDVLVIPEERSLWSVVDLFWKAEE